MDATDTLLLAALEEGLPSVAEPFAAVGERLGIPAGEVIARVRRLKEAGIIRKFRARIDQRKVGIVANALVAWKPGDSGNGDTGARLAAFPSVTHCYEREPVPGRWEYTHYTVHHGYSRDAVEHEVETIARAIGCPDYTLLFSTREFKRVPNVRMGENGGGS